MAYMEDETKSGDRYLSQLITSAKMNPLRIYIPIQREYVWDEEFVNNFIGEFEQVIDSAMINGPGYCHLKDYMISSLTNYLLDGQQRITTCLILIRVLLYIFEKENRKDVDEIMKLKKELEDRLGRKVIMDDVTKNIKRYQICDIENEDEFFSIFYYVGGREGELFTEMFRRELSTKNLDKLFAGRIPKRRMSNFSIVALIWYHFVTEMSEKYPSFTWNKLISRIKFTETALAVKEGDEQKIIDIFCPINTYNDPIGVYTMTKALVHNKTFYEVIERDEIMKYIYPDGNRNYPQDDFMRHCYIAYLLEYCENTTEVNDIISNANHRITQYTTYKFYEKYISSRNNKDKFVELCHRYHDFYYGVYNARKNPMLNSIRELNCSVLMPALFVIYDKYYETDIDMFNNCLRAAYVMTLLTKIDDGRPHIILPVHKLLYSLIGGTNVNLYFRLGGVNRLEEFEAGNVSSVYNIITNSTDKTKIGYVLAFVEKYLRDYTKYSSNDGFIDNAGEKSHRDIDHLIPVGNERGNGGIINTIGNMFFVYKTDNVSKSNSKAVDFIKSIYDRSSYFTTRMFLTDDMNGYLNIGQSDKMKKLFEKIDKSGLFQGSMAEEYDKLRINDDSFCEDYIIRRGTFLGKLASYIIMSECLSLKKFFTDNNTAEADVEFAEEPMTVEAL